MDTRRDYYTTLIDRVVKMQDAWVIQADHIRTDRPMRLRADAIKCITKAMVDGEYKKAEGWTPLLEIKHRVNVALSKGDVTIVASRVGCTRMFVAGFRCIMTHDISGARMCLMLADFPMLPNEVGEDYIDQLLRMAEHYNPDQLDPLVELHEGIDIYDKYHSFFNIMT